VNAIRGIPLLMVIFWMYFLLPAFMGMVVPESWTVIAALTVFTSAYMSEIVRAGIMGIPRGQTEAAESTGLTHRQTMLYVILPQALRRMIPPMMGLFTTLINDTSLAAIIGAFELTRAAQEIIERTYRSLEIYLVAAALYFLICYPLSYYTRKVEQRRVAGV